MEMDQACVILLILLPYSTNGQLGLLSSFIPSGGLSSFIGGGFSESPITSLSNFLPLDPVTSPPPPDTTTVIDLHVAALGANAGFDLATGILTATGDKTAAKVSSFLGVGNTLVNDIEAIRQYQLSKTTPAPPPPKPLKGLLGPDGVQYVIIDGRLYSLPSISGGVPITQSPLPPSPSTPSTPPPIYVPYGPRTINLPNKPTSAGSPYYAYCPLLTRYGDTNVWCFLYDRRLRRVGLAMKREGEEETKEERLVEGLENDNVILYDSSSFVYTLTVL